MNYDERKEALDYIRTKIPKEVYVDFMVAIARVHKGNDDRVIQVIKKICNGTLNHFRYQMDYEEEANKITPIREILDILEGWIITSTIEQTSPRVTWLATTISESEE